VFSVLHCIVQLIPQSQAFRINDQAVKFLRSVLSQGNAIETGFPVLGDDGLRICDYVPTPFNASTCQLIWDGTRGSGNSIGIPNNQSVPNVPTTSPPVSRTASSTSSTLLDSAITSFSPNPAGTGGATQPQITVTVTVVVRSAPAIGDAFLVSDNVANVRPAGKTYKEV
jgi:hypothetical protein